MEKSISLGGVRFQLAGAESAQIDESASAAFHLAVLGDFSGRAHRGISEPSRIAGLRAVDVDRDNFDDVMAQLAPKLELPTDQGTLEIEFRELDDFEPDRLVEKVNVFSELRTTRRRLKNTDTYAKAAEDVRSWASLPEPEAPAPAAEPPSAPQEASTENSGSGGLLDQLVAATEQAKSGEGASRTEPDSPIVKAIVSDIVRPYILPKADPQRDELIACVDEATSAHMREILHHPYFQALEATWRGLYFLVRRLPTHQKLRVFLIDVTKQELASDLSSQDELSTTGLWKMMVEKTVNTAGKTPYALVVADYQFEPTVEDAQLLARTGLIVSSAKATLLAGASPAFVGCDSFGLTSDHTQWQQELSDEALSAWTELAQQEVASYIGLVAPRFLLRLPYGRESYPMESFAFEEIVPPYQHNHFLWANGAFAVSYLIAENFSRSGWSFRPNSLRDLEDMPAFLLEVDGEKEMLPCAEALLSERALDKLALRGLIPLVSVANQDVVRVGRFQSLAQPVPVPLTGRWRGS